MPIVLGAELARVSPLVQGAPPIELLPCSVGGGPGSENQSWVLKPSGYNDFDIIFGPVSHGACLFTALHAPGDVPYLVTMVVGC